MKLSDYVVSYLEKFGIDTIFGYQGSSVAHLVDSVSKSKNITYIQTLHEQAASFAANGYALCKNSIGAALACSGPGAINLINGIANSYYDSVPCIFITGQVSTSGIRDENSKIRQLGFQETDIVSIVKSITKYAVTIKNKDEIAFHLEKAFYLMLEGRPGPVLLDIPHNIQASIVEPERFKHFKRVNKKNVLSKNTIKESIEILKKAQRPLMLLGGGARSLKDNDTLEMFLRESNLPVISSYLGKDIIDNEIVNYIGVLGAYGNRYANWAVQYCDVLLIIGSRIDERQTGGDLGCFAEDAQIIYVDIDSWENMGKPERYLKIVAESSEFIKILLEDLKGVKWSQSWLTAINIWKNRYVHWKEYTLSDGVNPNKFIFDLTCKTTKSFAITVDVGQNQIWTNASSLLKKGCYLIQSGGLGSMGFSLPAAIGAFYSHRYEEIFCFCGDGGIQMNIQELGTISTNKIPIKIIVFNNQSLGLIRVYQEKALKSNFEGSVYGFASPQYEDIAKAYSIEYIQISDNNYDEKLQYIIENNEAMLVEVRISKQSTCFPEPTYRSTFNNQSEVLANEEKERIRLEAYASKKI